MRPTLLRVCAVLSSVASLGTSIATPLYASGSDPFAYKLEFGGELDKEDTAVSKRYTALFEACQKRAFIEHENVACFDAEFVRQDAELNRAWKIALGRLPAMTRKPLLIAQRKWIAARDPFCKTIEDGLSGGTIAPVSYSDCRVEQTIRRTVWLENLR